MFAISLICLHWLLYVRGVMVRKSILFDYAEHPQRGFTQYLIKRSWIFRFSPKTFSLTAIYIFCIHIECKFPVTGTGKVKQLKHVKCVPTSLVCMSVGLIVTNNPVLFKWRKREKNSKESFQLYNSTCKCVHGGEKNVIKSMFLLTRVTFSCFFYHDLLRVWNQQASCTSM